MYTPKQSEFLSERSTRSREIPPAQYDACQVPVDDVQVQPRRIRAHGEAVAIPFEALRTPELPLHRALLPRLRYP